MKLKSDRVSYALFFVCAFFIISAPIVYACSPGPNLLILCGHETLQFRAYYEEGLTELISSCEIYSNVAEELAGRLADLKTANFFDSDGFAIIAPETPTPGQNRIIESELNHGPCYSQQSEQSKGGVLYYTIRQPYCVETIALFCSSYTVSMTRKLIFDFQNSQFVSPFILLFTSITAIVSGNLLAVKQFHSLQSNPILKFTIVKKRLFLALFLSFLILIIIIVACLFTGLFVYIIQVIQWILQPSSFEYFVRVGLAAFAISFIFTVNTLNRNN